ncbi:GEM-like protein 6 [Impatiens glandulifera]|uniref:GEM-like protein 6 n=1 Tax=Impatiens glandulifera TaxID=253017 RepID=UPI001FB05643|nr:GEM-like protein 6 [Impatiens glandulifera]
MKNLMKTVESFTKFPISSNRFLLDHHVGSLKFNQIVINRKKRPTERAAHAVNSILDHVKLGSNISAIVKGKLSLGAKIVQNGGVGKVFKHKFNVENGEKILKASQCYISTTAGPIAGLLFITTNRISFCSERSIKLKSPNGMSARVHYKVSIPLGKIKGAIVSQNKEKPSQKHIELATVDNCDFWFMGFLNYQKTYTSILKAVSLPHFFQLTQ